MNCSMQDYLKIVTSHLHPDLVSAEAFSRIQSLAQILPSSSLAGFECRLGANQSGVDFQVRLPCLDQNLPERFLTAPAWQFLQDFYRNWALPNSSLHQEIENIGLEFDVNGQLPQVPIPCIFLKFNREPVIDAQNLIKVTTRLIKSRVSPLLETNLRRCADSLPTGATISHLGAMLSRQANAVRVNVKGISPEQLSHYLMQLGWNDPTNTFSTLTSTLSEFVDFIILSFDVGDAVLPRIGLECFVDNQPDEEARWRLFLDYLVEGELCTPAKKNAFLAWPGFSLKSSVQDLWPSNISFGDRFLGSRAFSLFWRRLNHLKLVYQPGIPLEAKGYLAFGHTWFERNVLLKNWQKTEESNPTDSPISETTKAATSQYLERVRSYYDTMNPLIIKHVGKIYQAGLLVTDSNADPTCAHNLYLASQAGIQPGHHVLDAGCGVCGPSLDIAQNIAGVQIDAITISPVQADTAKKFVHQAGLEEQIRVHVGDFHHLPFADETFEVVCFFESSGYSYDRQQLFAEVYRVLRPGGTLYIKDVFCKELPLSTQQQQELEEFDRIYAQYKTPQLSETVKAISAVGFQAVESRALSEMVSTKDFVKAMFEYKHGFPFLSEFGKFHYRQLQCLPIFFGEVKARKLAL